MPLPFDQKELLEKVDNDIEFLTETIQMLASDGPPLMKEIRRASDWKDAAALAKSAHTLKGMISNFCAAGALACAAEVEAIARKGDLSRAPVAVDELEIALDTLITALNEFVATRT